MDAQSRVDGLKKLQKKYIREIEQAISTLAKSRDWDETRDLAHVVLRDLDHSLLYKLGARVDHVAEAILVVVETRCKYDPKFAVEQVKDLKLREEQLDKIITAHDLLDRALVRSKDRVILSQLNKIRSREEKWFSDQKKWVEKAQNAILRAWAPLSWIAFESYRWDVLADILLTRPMIDSVTIKLTLFGIGNDRDRLRKSLKARASQLYLTAPTSNSRR